MCPVSLIISGSDYCFVYHLRPLHSHLTQESRMFRKTCEVNRSSSFKENVSRLWVFFHSTAFHVFECKNYWRLCSVYKTIHKYMIGYCFVHPNNLFFFCAVTQPCYGLLTYFSQIICLAGLWNFVLHFWISLKTGDFNITSSSLFCGVFFLKYI